MRAPARANPRSSIRTPDSEKSCAEPRRARRRACALPRGGRSGCDQPPGRHNAIDPFPRRVRTEKCAARSASGRVLAHSCESPLIAMRQTCVPSARTASTVASPLRSRDVSDFVARGRVDFRLVLLLVRVDRALGRSSQTRRASQRCVASAASPPHRRSDPPRRFHRRARRGARRSSRRARPRRRAARQARRRGRVTRRALARPTRATRSRTRAAPPRTPARRARAPRPRPRHAATTATTGRLSSATGSARGSATPLGVGRRR